MEGGANFSRSLRKVTSLETLKDETAQMRQVREKEARTLSHFESLALEVGEWSWKGASVRENSLHTKDSSSFVKRHLIDSDASISFEMVDSDLHQLPPLLSSTAEPSFHHNPGEKTLQSNKKTSGDDITSIRRGMQAISHKTASLFALTELNRPDSSALSSQNSDGKRTRYSRLLQQGDALVEQAIHHMERVHQLNDSNSRGLGTYK